MDQFELLLLHVPYALLVIFRVAGLMMFAPVLSSSVIVARAKVLLAVSMGVAVYPVVAVTPSEAIPLDLFGLVPLLLFETATGIAIGFIGLLPLQAVQMGGRMMSQQMGLAFAQIYNPAMETTADVLGQALFFLTLAGFLLVGGLDSLFLAVMNSFHHLPTGTGAIDGDLIALLLGLLTSSFELGLRVAAPVMGIIFIQGVAMGFVTKTVPQVNILSLGFPLRILIGFAVVAFGLSVINDVVMEGVDEGLNALFGWIESRS